MVLSLQTTQRVDEIVARAQSQARAPSVVAAVVRDGTVAHVAGAGESPRPDSDTQYRIGSITKTLTAAVVLLLRDEGRLDLDDPLDAHLPGTGVGEVRVRQLLGHVGGMQREPDGLWWERHAGVSLDELVKGIGPDKLAFRPYQRYHYSNLAYGLLGGVVERLTGQSWWDEVSRRLLEPLGMTRTTYHPADPFAVGYVVHPWQATLREEPRHDSGAMAPAGQLWSTAADLARWAAVLAAPEEPGRYAAAKRETPVLTPATVAEMALPVSIADPDTWSGGYGLGLQLWRHGDRVFVGHGGSMPGYLAMLVAHRRSGTAVVAYANTYSMLPAGIGDVGRSIMEAVLDGEPPAAATVWRSAAPPPPDVAPLCGRWWWMGREYESTWDADRAQLVVHGVRSGALVGRFVREEDDRWRGRDGDNAGEVLRVRRDPAGAVTALDIATFVFTRDEFPAD
jgi:CubicO group peptidase (beta-lactamase class C family)